LENNMKFFKEIQKPVNEASRPDAYQRDEINATSGFGKDSYAYQMDGGANDEDHEGDARREKQEKSGTWYIRLNGKLIKDKAGKPYSFHGKAAANKAALTMQAKLFNQGKEFMLTTNPNDKVAEDAKMLTRQQPKWWEDSEKLRKELDAPEDSDQQKSISSDSKKYRIRRPTFSYPLNLTRQESTQNSVPEGAESGAYYGEQVAQQIFDKRQDISSEEEVLNQAYHIVSNELGQKSARYMFNYDEDFPSDVVSNYFHLQKQGVAESTLRESDSPVAGAITRRILLQRSDLLQKYGPQKVMAAIDDVADFVGDTEEIGSSDVSGWIKQVEQTLETMGEGIEEASLAQMRDYFNQPDDSMSVNRAPARTGKPNPNVPQEIQNLINKMYHSGKVTPEEFKILQDFQRKTKINVGIKEATTGNAGYDSMLAVMKAVDAGQDATFDLGGEPITLDYNEARFLAGRYKAFLKAGRQEEFLKYMENPMSFDHLMKQLRDLIDKQKNFKGSVQGERGIEEGSQRVDSLVTKGLEKMQGPRWLDAVAAIKAQVGERDYRDRKQFYDGFVQQLVNMYGKKGMAENMQSLPAVNENEYWCQIDSTAKPIPEGYKKLASGYITKVSK